MSVIVDANLVVSIVLPLPYSESARRKMAMWKQQDEPVLAPVLWEFEVTSALRKAVSLGLLDDEEAVGGLRKILTLNVQSVSPTETLQLEALNIAGRLGQSRAYDSQYLALAEELGAILWTGDRSLANGAGHVGIKWVRWVGEE